MSKFIRLSNIIINTSKIVYIETKCKNFSQITNYHIYMQLPYEIDGFSIVGSGFVSSNNNNNCIIVEKNDKSDDCKILEDWISSNT
jgi:hypothetical protein